MASLTAFSLAALLTLYSGKSEITFIPNDTPEHVKFIQTVWNSENILETVSQILSNRDIWKENLMSIEPLAPTVAGFVQSILSVGMRKSLEAVLNS